MPVAKATPQSVSARIYKAITAAENPRSVKGKKISHTETQKIERAMDRALDEGFKKLDPDALFMELPYAAGFGVMQTIQSSDFANQRDFRHLWNKAVDIAAAAPDIGNYLPD